MGRMLYLSTFLVDFDGTWVGKYTVRPMDASCGKTEVIGEPKNLMVANTIVSFWAPARFQWRTVSFRECKLPIEHHGSGVKQLIEDASQHDLPLIFRNSKLDFVPQFSSENLSRCVFLCRTFPHKWFYFGCGPFPSNTTAIIGIIIACAVANPKLNLHLPRLHPGGGHT